MMESSRLPRLFLRCFAIVAAVLVTLSAARAAHFVAAEQIDMKATLPAPPAADSLVTLAELDVIVQMEEDRTPAQTDLARNPPTGNVFVFAAGVLGPWFTPENLPKTAALFSRIDQDGQPITAAAKSTYPERLRPYLVDARVTMPTSRPGGSTYPSGAGYNTAVWASVLEVILPEYADALRARARFACWTRVIAGVHYPTDNTGGRILGDAVAQKLLALPAAQAALAEIRVEIESVRRR